MSQRAFTQSRPDHNVLLPICTADQEMLIVASRYSHRDTQRKATRARDTFRFRIKCLLMSTFSALVVLLQIKRVDDPDVCMQTISILGQTGRVEATKEVLKLLNCHKKRFEK